MASFGTIVFVTILFGKIEASTYKNRFLAGYTFDISYPNDWLTCSLKCQHLQNCVSYNFHLVFGSCELNDHGLLKEYKPEDQLSEAKGYIFHQLRPVFKEILPAKRMVQNQCDCDCSSRSACTSNPVKQTSPLPLSCNELWQKKRPASGAHDIKLEAEKVRLFCQMNETQACGSGGWTLVMKIDGSKSTFTYNSTIWTNKKALNIENGYDLAEKEAKLSSYWSTPLTKLCLGMKHKGKTNWIVTQYTAKSLYDVIKQGDNRRTNVDPNTWKSLVLESDLWTGCIWEGFNAKSNYTAAAKARIGIVGADKPKACNPPVSRIGFGTSGSHYGMNDSNSCGNEFKSDKSSKHMMAFGYILVQ